MLLRTALKVATLAMKAKAAHDAFKAVSDMIPAGVKSQMTDALSGVTGTGQQLAVEALEKYAPGIVGEIAERNAKPGEPALTEAKMRDMLAEAVAKAAKSTPGKKAGAGKRKKNAL